MPDKPQTEHFQVLDSWRGICAMLVAVFHFDAYWHFYNVDIFRGSWLFVDFFFVLSGFVVTHAYMNRLGDFGQFRSFVIRRFGRLWPLHMATLLLVVAPEIFKWLLLKFGGFTAEHPAFTGARGIDALIEHVFLLQSLGFHDELTWNGVSWSISTEFYTYIVFALVILFARTPRATLLWSVAIILLSLCISYLARHPDVPAEAHLRFAMFRCLYGFFAGHLFYRLWKRDALPVLGSGGWAAVEILTCVLVFAFVALCWRTAGALAAPLVFGVAVLVFAQERGPVSAMLKKRPMLFLGMLSYSIYMVHPLVSALFSRFISFVGGRLGVATKIEVAVPGFAQPPNLYFVGNQWAMDAYGILYLVCVVAVATLTYKLVEKPGRDFFNARAKSK